MHSISIQTLAQFSKIAYTENFRLMKAKASAQDADWWLAATSVETPGAYDLKYNSFAMDNEETKEVLVINAGTKAHHKNKLLAFVADGEKFIDSLVQKFPDYSFINTGHSEGALYAQLSHAYLASKGIASSTVVFESEGASKIVNTYLTKNLKASEEFKDFIIQDIQTHSDVYNTKDTPQLGTLYVLPSEDIIPVASTLGKIAGIKGADNIFNLVDTIFSPIHTQAKTNEQNIDYIISKLDEEEIELAPCSYAPTKGDDLVKQAIAEFASLFDL